MQNENALVNINRIDYIQLLSKKRVSRWDDNFKPCKNKIFNRLDAKNLSRRSRWGADWEKTFIPVPMTSIPENLDPDEFEILIRRYRLDDISRRLLSGEYENLDPDVRSPSPEPIYDSKSGQRLNTRDVRAKEKYIKEKNSLIEELILLDHFYIPPHDYKPPRKIKKLYIPEIEKVNFIGIILGPRGVTQRELEKKSGCKISIRGRGSNWNNSSEKTYHDENENLHVFLQADTEDQLRKGISMIEPLLDPNSSEHILHKQKQKNAVATMYGLLKEHACENCGEKGHRTWACPLNFGIYNQGQVQCDICGDKSHPTRDCPEKKILIDNADSKDVENEFFKFLREIDDFKAQTDVLVLEQDYKPDHIRNSILFTGKMPENISTEPIKTENKSNSSEIKIDNQISVDKATPKEHEPMMIEASLHYEHMQMQQDNNTVNNKIKNNEDEFIKTDYKVPFNPIVHNPNVIRAAPMNNMMPPQMHIPLNMPNMQPPMNNYYNTYINPYVYPSSGVNYMNINLPRMNGIYTRPSLISSNFQGKIPTSYGLGMPNINGVNPNTLNTLNAINQVYAPRLNHPGMPNNFHTPPHLINPNQFRPPEPETIEEPMLQPPEPEDDVQVDKIK